MCAICGNQSTGQAWGHPLCAAHWRDWQTVPLPPSLRTETVAEIRAYLARPGGDTSAEWQERTDAWVKAQKARAA